MQGQMGKEPEELAALIREMRGKGRCDLSQLLCNAEAFRSACERLADPFKEDEIDVVAGLDAAGLPFAAGVALQLGAGLVMLRREGKNAWDVRSATCRDYSGTEKTFELVTDAVTSGQRCLVVDDWSETGEQLALAKRLLESAGAIVVGCACVNIDAPARRHPQLLDCRLESVIDYQGPASS